MTTKSEIRKIVDFVSDQRRHANSTQHWKRRIEAFGFTIEDTDKGAMIAMLPKRRVVCAVPQHLCG